jgi:hypothetical protein
MEKARIAQFARHWRMGKVIRRRSFAAAAVIGATRFMAEC